MTQATSSKTQLGNQAWRRHTDPPGLWISVVIASVILHLLGIWLIRFSGSIFSLQQDSASVIPIDFVEVAPVKQETKSVVSRKSPVKKSPVNSTKPVVSNNPQRKITPKNPVSNGIALRDNTTKQKVTPKKRSPFNTSKPARQRTGVPSSPVKKQVAQSNKPQRATRQKPPVTSNPPARKPQQPPVNSNTPAKKPQQPPVTSNTPARKPQQPPVSSNPPARKPQKPPVNSNPPVRKPQKPPVNSNTPTKNTGTNQPWNRSRGDIKLGTGKKLDSNPLPNQPSSNVNSQAGMLLVRVNPLSRQDILARKFRNPPEVMAKYIGNQASTLDISIRDKYPGLKDAKLIVSLVIDKNGKFEQAHVLSIEPQILAVNKSQYQKFFNEHFRNQKFTPASSNTGIKPEVSNLYIRIAVETNLPGSMLENK